MIDYTQLGIPPEYGRLLLAHPILSFQQPVDVQTGEYRDTDAREAVFRGMTFTIYSSGRITLHGSWHKYHHNGTNWQDFTLEEFREAVREFCNTFNLDPSRLQLLQLEAGCNVTPPLPTRATLRAFVCNGQGKAFATMRTRKGQPLGLELYLTDYALKVYDKGAQYNLTDQRLRYERKFTSWCKFRDKAGIFTLADLLHAEAWHTLAAYVSETFSTLVLREPSVDPQQMQPRKRLFFAEAGRPGYWYELPREERHKARERLRDLVREYGAANLHEELRTRIDAKLRELIDPDRLEETGDVFHHIPPNPARETEDVFHHVREGCGHLEPGRFPTSFNDGKCPRLLEETGEDELAAKPDEFTARRCRTCGRDISNQRPGSVFCSERLHGRAAKRCRNADSNPRNNDLRKLQRIEGDPLLFDHSPFLRAISNGIKTECAGHK
jgi:hypothetical protein